MRNILLFIFLSNLLIFVKCFSYNLEYSYFDYKNSYSNNLLYSNYFLSNANSNNFNSNNFNSNNFNSNNFNSNNFNSKSYYTNNFNSNFLTSFKHQSLNNYLSIIKTVSISYSAYQIKSSVAYSKSDKFNEYMSIVSSMPLPSSKISTLSPSFTPSFAPTFAPTSINTFTPTLINTFTPTSINTFTPTFTPSFAPSFAPSSINTFAPTSINSFVPTLSPTLSPTSINTFVPTLVPTSIKTKTEKPTILEVPIISFDTKLTFDNYDTIDLDIKSQEVIIIATANSMNISDSYVEYIGSTIKTRRLSIFRILGFNIIITLKTTIPLRGKYSLNPSSLYTTLTTNLINSVNSGLFTSYLLTASNKLNISSFINSSITSVQSDNYVIKEPDEHDIKTKNQNIYTTVYIIFFSMLSIYLLLYLIWIRRKYRRKIQVLCDYFKNINTVNNVNTVNTDDILIRITEN